MDIRSGYADVNGAQLYYEEAGEGFPVVMVHAGIADRRMWDDQFPALAEKYRAIRYDMRGFGKSKMVPGPYSLRDDLYGMMRFLGVERAYLMGCSMGGGAIIDFAIEHPEMAAALVTVCAGLSGFEFKGEMPKYYQEMEAAGKKGDFDSAAEYAVRIWLDGRSRAPEALAPALRAKVHDMSRIAFSTPDDLGKDQPLNPPAVERLEALRLPMLVVVGDLDDPNIMDIADLLLTAVPEARKVVMTNTAHLPNMERPQEFNQVMMGFLAGVDQLAEASR